MSITIIITTIIIVYIILILLLLLLFLLLLLLLLLLGKWTSHHWFRCKPLRTASGLEHLHGRRGRGSRRGGRGGEDVERQGAEDAINGW